jgi:pyruvate dehydrogenase E2 component (dihydrolipoamide acetyltransferase)
MSYEFKLPDIGEGVAEGEIVQWFVTEGQTIQEDQPLVSVLTDKANVEIPSPKSGRILKLHAAVGEKVKVGGPLVTFDVAGGPAAPPTPPPGAPTERPAVPGGATPSGSVSIPSSRPAGVVAPDGPEASARVLATPQVRRLAAQRGIDLGRIHGSGPGGRITEADLGATTSAPASAPATTTSTPAETTADPGWAGPSPTVAPPSERPGPVAPIPPATGDTSGGFVGASAGKEERVPLRGVRRIIAEHMSTAVHRAAHYTYVEEIDATELVSWRERMAKHVEKQGVRLSYLPFIVKAVTAGLKAHPWMNARMDDERNELVVYPEYHIGIATAAPEGLIVPIVRNADRKSVSQLAKEIQDLAERGRAGKLERSELVGGTFTITSLGALGGVMATPILNYPEVAILGVHKIAQRPVYRADGTIGPAQLMNLSVSLDHRVLDGVVAAHFLAEVKSHLEDPHRLFAEMA